MPDRIEIHEMHTPRYHMGVKRGKRKKATPEQVARQNQWKRERHIRHLLLMNFHQYDYFTTLTYRLDERPETLEEAKKDFRKFIARIRGHCRKTEQEFKWMVIGERGERGGLHFHFVMARIRDGDRVISSSWPHGGNATELLKKPETFGRLAHYLAKTGKLQKEKQYFSHSRGLKEPKVIREEMKRKTFRERPFVPKGYYLDKDSVTSGESPVTGQPFRRYTVMRC